jgi:hypothetical protein
MKKLFEIEDIFGYILSFIDRSILRSLIFTCKEFNNFICKDGSFFTSIIWEIYDFRNLKKLPNYVTYVYGHGYHSKEINNKNYIGVPPDWKKLNKLYENYLNGVKIFDPDRSIFKFNATRVKHNETSRFRSIVKNDSFICEDYSSLLSGRQYYTFMLQYDKNITKKNNEFLRIVRESKYFISSKYAIFPKKRAKLYFPNDLTKRFCEVLGLKEIWKYNCYYTAICGSIILRLMTKNLDEFVDEYKDSDLDICLNKRYVEFNTNNLIRDKNIKFHYFNLDLERNTEFNSMLANFHLSCVRALLFIVGRSDELRHKIECYALPSFFKTIETGYCENIKFFSKEKDYILKILYKYFRRGVGFNFNKGDMKIFEKYLGEIGHNEYEIVNLF